MTEVTHAAEILDQVAFGPKRLDDYPDTPTFKELGYDIVWEMP